MTEDEKAGWNQRLEGHGFGWTPAVGDVQGGLVCCSPWSHKESDTTEQLNSTESLIKYLKKRWNGEWCGKKKRCGKTKVLFWEFEMLYDN